MFEEQKGFIHTFSISTKLSEEEFYRIKTVYKDNGYFYNGDTKRGILSAFAERGMRMEIKNNTEKEVRYDKQHRKKTAVMIFTLYKLLYPGSVFGKLLRIAEINAACDRMSEIINEIAEKTSVDLFANAKLSRVDVTFDVVTPSEMYSQEIIRVAKMSQLKRGYSFWIPEEDEKYNARWDKIHSVFLYNHSQEVEAKVYNKKQDEEIQEHIPEEIKAKGLVRFELSLKRNYLKRNGYISAKFANIEEIGYLLSGITERSEQLLLQHLSGILDTGDMLSRPMLLKFIKKECGSKKKKAEKMKDYVKWINKEYGQSKTYEGSLRLREYFVEFGISPIYLKKECPYLPSFSKILFSELELDARLLQWVKRYNEKHGYKYEYWR